MIKRICFILALLASPAFLRAQTAVYPAGSAPIGAARILATGEIGTASGLGYQLPHLSAGIDLEKPLGSHWEAQGGVSWSPDRKYLTGQGNAVRASASGLFWPIQDVAVTGGVEYSHLWAGAFQKSAWFPFAGAILRDGWYGSPGRFYVHYVFSAGCQWATAANPCTIQSNRISGVEGFQEFRLWPHWRFGIRGAWWHFADQSNPLDPAAGRVWHDTGTVAVVVRYEFRAGSVDESY